MDARTLTALEASIAKWERNAAIENLDGAQLGVLSCPLCMLFHSNGCIGCPVFGDGHFQCDSTPYDEALDAANADNLTAFIAAARAEVEFLKSLLPYPSGAA